MTLQELLVGQGIDLARTKLIRHNLSKKVIAENYEHGYLELYQSIQSPVRFKNCDMVISFLGKDGTTAEFQGCYRVGSTKPYKRAEMPEDFAEDCGMDDCVIWELTPIELWGELKGRLLIEWGKGTQSWCNNGTTKKEILAIKPAVSKIDFPGYDRVLLSFETLHEIIFNEAAHKKWRDKLSAVAGVYLITDTKTGMLYVGSASGEQGGIWGRWSEYAHTKHGGNKRLIQLIAADENYCRYFQFSILEVLPIKWDRHEVLECEQLYKEKLLSIPFGLNEN